MTGLIFYENFGSQSVEFLNNGVLETLWHGAAGNSGDSGADSTVLGGAPELSYDGHVYFNGLDQNGSSNLMVFDEATNKTVNYEFSHTKVWGSGLDPQDFVAVRGAQAVQFDGVYFVGDDAAGNRTLWTTNLTLSGTHEISGSPIDNGQMASVGGEIFFNGGADHDLMTYSNGAFEQALDTPKGLNPLDTTYAGLDNGQTAVPALFFNGTDSHGKQDLFSYWADGFHRFALNEIGPAGLDPRDLTVVNFGHTNGVSGGQTALFFNGVDNSAAHPGVDGEKSGRGLYMATATSSGGVTDSLVAAGLDPQDITALDGDVYFAGLDGNKSDPSAEGLWVYNPSAKPGGQLKEIASSSNYDLDMNSSILGSLMNPQSQIAASGGELYFDATHGNTVQGLFAYNPATNQISVHVGGTAGTLPYNLMAA
jgi:hypothetical protein